MLNMLIKVALLIGAMIFIMIQRDPYGAQLIDLYDGLKVVMVILACAILFVIVSYEDRNYG